MVLKSTSTTYYIDGDLEVRDNKLVIGEEEIDLSKVRDIHLYLIYNFAEVEMEVFLGWIEPERIKRMCVNRVRKIEFVDNVTLAVYIDFEDLFAEGD